MWERSKTLKNERPVARVLDYEAFSEPVPFKIDDQPLEPGALASRAYYRRGVREVDDATFERIFSLANPDAALTGSAIRTTALWYAHDSELARKVDDYAISVAQALLEERYQDGVVEVMPHNNPGYDLRVVRPAQRDLHVEVKGSRLKENWRVFLTEGERLHSCQYEASVLVVVFGIDLETGIHSIFEHHGRIDTTAFSLEVTQWELGPQI